MTLPNLNWEKSSGVGLALCLLYGLATIGLLVAGFLSEGQDQVFLLRLPIYAQLMAVNEAGIHIFNKGWGIGYVGLFPPTLILLYIIGALLQWGFAAFKGSHRNRSAL